MAAVMIGVDPHKGSHTAVAIGAAEEPLGELRVRAARRRPSGCWRGRRPGRSGPGRSRAPAGLGHLLAQQLVAAGERVLDVQPKLGARVRLLAAGDTNKNDPNDARSVAVAALRSAGVRARCRPDDHAAVLKVWSKRHRDLGRTRTQVACRLHAVLCELVPGGVAKEITAAHAARLLEQVTPSGRGRAGPLGAGRRVPGGPAPHRRPAARDQEEAGRRGPGLRHHPDRDLRRRPGHRRHRHRRGRATSSRFASRDHFAAYNGTAPVEVSSGNRKVHRLSRRGNRRVNHAIHMAAITQIRHRAQRGPRLLRQEDRRGQDPQGGPARAQAADQRRHLRPPAAPTPAARPQAAQAGPGRASRGTTLTPARPAHTPDTGSSDKPLPDLAPPYDPDPAAQPKKRTSQPTKKTTRTT